MFNLFNVQRFMSHLFLELGLLDDATLCVLTLCGRFLNSVSTNLPVNVSGLEGLNDVPLEALRADVEAVQEEAGQNEATQDMEVLNT